MKQSGSIGRRGLLGASVAAAAGAVAGCGRSRGSWRFFSDAQARTVDAVCEAIIPEDRDPGASKAGAVRYIDRQLAGKFRPLQPVYRDGIAAADRLAGGSFAALDPARREEILRGMEKGAATKAFFDLVVAHTMQGFYGNPRHGGNREYASWLMLGISPAQVRGRDRYEFPKGGPA